MKKINSIRKHFYPICITFFCLISTSFSCPAQDIIVFDTTSLLGVLPHDRSPATTRISMETCSLSQGTYSGISYIPDNVNGDNNIYVLDGTLSATGEYFVIIEDQFGWIQNTFMTDDTSSIPVFLGHPHIFQLAEPYGFETSPLGISSDYSGMGYFVGNGLSQYDFVNHQVTYLQDLLPAFQAGGQMAFCDGSFYYPNRNKELVQLKVRESGVFYRIVGTLPDTINYGGLFAIPNACDSTGLFIINNNTNFSSTIYRINLEEFGLEEFCLYEGDPNHSILGAKGNVLSAVYLQERDFYACDLLLDLQPQEDTTINLYYEICGGSLSLIVDDLFLNPLNEFDSLSVQIINPFDGNQEMLSAIAVPEISVENNNTDRLLLKSLGFAETDDYLSALTSLIYNNMAFPASAGTRTIIITAYHPYHGTVSAEIIIHIDPNLHDIDANEMLLSPSCYGDDSGSIQLNPSGGETPYSITWEDNSNGLILSNLQAANYAVTITDAFFCTKALGLELLQPDSLLVSIFAQLDTICGQTGILNASIQGGILPYEILWNTSDDEQQISGLGAGLYNVTVNDDNNCEAIATYSLFDSEAIEENIIVNLCEGEVFNWRGEPFSSDTSFCQTIIHPDACDTIYCIDIDVFPVFSSTENYTICEGEFLELRGEIFSRDTAVIWDYLSINDCDSIIQAIITVLPAFSSSIVEICEGETYIFNDQNLFQGGVYLDTLIGTSGCDSIVSLQLLIRPNLMPDITQDGILCGNQMPVLSIGEFENYIWSNGSTASNIQVEVAGFFSVTVTDDLGCIGSSSINIENGQINTTFNLVQSECPGDVGVIQFLQADGGVGPYQLQWDNLSYEVPNNIEIEQPSTFSADLVDLATGCTEILNFDFESVENQLLILPEVIEITIGDSVVIVPEINFTAISFVWSSSGFINCKDCTSINVSPKETVRYFLEVIDENGCVYEASIAILVDLKEDIFVPNVFSPNDDGFNDVFTVFTGRGVKEITSLTIFNRWGGLIYEVKAFPLEWDGMQNGMEALSATYIYSIEWLDLSGGKRKLNGDFVLIR